MLQLGVIHDPICLYDVFSWAWWYHQSCIWRHSPPAKRLVCQLECRRALTSFISMICMPSSSVTLDQSGESFFPPETGINVMDLLSNRVLYVTGTSDSKIQDWNHMSECVSISQAGAHRNDMCRDPALDVASRLFVVLLRWHLGLWLNTFRSLVSMIH